MPARAIDHSWALSRHERCRRAPACRARRFAAEHDVQLTIIRRRARRTAYDHSPPSATHSLRSSLPGEICIYLIARVSDAFCLIVTQSVARDIRHRRARLGPFSATERGSWSVPASSVSRPSSKGAHLLCRKRGVFLIACQNESDQHALTAASASPSR